MKIEYIARKVNLTEPVRELTERKLAKVEKYFNDIIDIRVELAQERHLFAVDVFIKGKDFDIRSTVQNKDLTTAIHEAIDKLEMQARKAKSRLKDNKRHAEAVKESPDWSEDVLEPDSVAAGEPVIVTRTPIPVKPMTIDEAMMQLQGSGNDFIVFRNASSDRVNVLYRRRDHNLGLITPEF
jgi:putative sigma-54 modulation protein